MRVASSLIGILLLSGVVSAQVTSITSIVSTQPLTYSKGGEAQGCGIHIVAATGDGFGLDASINVNYDREKDSYWGLFKMGAMDLVPAANGEFTSMPLEVTFARAESAQGAIDTKKGQKSDAKGYFIGVVDGLIALKMLSSALDGQSFMFTIAIKGRGYDKKVSAQLKRDPFTGAEISRCLGELAKASVAAKLK